MDGKVVVVDVCDRSNRVCPAARRKIGKEIFDWLVSNAQVVDGGSGKVYYILDKERILQLGSKCGLDIRDGTSISD